MRPVSLSELTGWADGALIQGSPNTIVSNLVTDSRKVADGDVFLAIKGERFDAHDFLEDVSNRNPAAVIVSNLTAATEKFTGAVIHVRDTLKSLQAIALQHRRASGNLRVIGITGSNGKTSTKDFIGAVLSAGGNVNRTAGNLNNHFGLPLTILSGTAEDRFGVWEMGMNHPGEIEVLAEIASPDAAVITNIGTAHIENMGTREAIASEKSEIAMAVRKGGYCVMPVADDFYGFVKERISDHCDLVGVGIGEGDVRAGNVKMSGNGKAGFDLIHSSGDSASVILPVSGKHMVLNSLLAAAVGLKEGIPLARIASALSTAELTGGRLQERKAGGFSFLDDSYNANPDSMRAALETLRDTDVKGRRVAVLGFMGELGEHADPEHLALGKRVFETGVDALITVSDKAELIHEGAEGLLVREHFSSHSEAAGFLRDFLTPDDLVLVKGSRAAAMENVIGELN
ncbi:MAG: UDP-N-acetylmuramoyl-tripeptide--D-alanyl-D-alanine ligase [Verrucomicrobiales bacterium]|nr:UDP-N-acetylmuramoyl-tripeptide--D-alanyl-D-alanine ligase [Verrucomicrobiales bacterium]